MHRHIAGLGALVAALAVAPGLIACGPPANPPVQPSADPPTAAIGADGEIEAKLLAPQGEWRLEGVEVDGARLISRDGDMVLQLRMKRSEPKLGETTVEGAGEPIVITVTYVDKKSGARERAVFRLAVPEKAEQGATVPVTVQW